MAIFKPELPRFCLLARASAGLPERFPLLDCVWTLRLLPLCFVRVACRSPRLALRDARSDPRVSSTVACSRFR